MSVRFGNLESVDEGMFIQDEKFRRGTEEVSIADYWCAHGFPYTEPQKRSVKIAKVTLGSGRPLSYPADQVFRLYNDPEFPEESDDDSDDSDDDSNDDDGAGKGGNDDDGSGSCGSGGLTGSAKDLQRGSLKPWSRRVVASPRDIFVASDGYVLLSADYAQVEVRLLAHYAEDEKLIEAFDGKARGQDSMDHDDARASVPSEDFFQRLARQWLKIGPSDPVPSAKRSTTKAICYGTLYSGGAEKMAQVMQTSLPAATSSSSSSSSSSSLSMVARMRQHKLDFLEAYPALAHFIERVKRDCQKGVDHTVRTICGRQRAVDQIQTQAVNTVTQGSAADIIKVAMVQINARLRRQLAGASSGCASTSPRAACLTWQELERRCCLVNMLHDELIYEVRKEDLAVVKEIVREEMENALPLKVRLQVQLKAGSRWGSMSPA